MRVSDLWRWHGTVGRGLYALVGVAGFAIKHNLDRALAHFSFHREWGIFNYWVPPTDLARLGNLPQKDVIFLATMLVMSLPFIWIGVCMTLKRLRSARLPLWMVALFFVPFVNLLFFAALCFIQEREGSTTSSSEPGLLARILPTNPLGAAGMTLVLPLVVGLLFTQFSIRFMNDYGWGVFVALPFAMGLSAVLLDSAREERSFKRCLGVALLSVALLGVALIALAIEGLICVVMAAPLGLLMALIGGAIGHGIQSRRRHSEEATAMLLLAILLPGTPAIEALTRGDAPVFEVKTELEVDAPPERVWENVIAFSTLEAPQEWIFRAGIAYPIRAEISGAGRGAVRHCVFSTGAFQEPIEVWDAPRHLKFSVTSNPAPMEEWTPYGAIHPLHLQGFLVSSGGQFLLTELPGDRTRIEGTTWYRHHMWPATYWQMWSDGIIHRIHLRVLRHIKQASEKHI